MLRFPLKSGFRIQASSNPVSEWNGRSNTLFVHGKTNDDTLIDYGEIGQGYRWLI